MSQVQNEDAGLGVIRQFPTVLHARASLVYEITTETLQKTLIHCLTQVRKSTQPIELSISDQAGYQEGIVSFRVGVGNEDGYDILDTSEEDRVLRKMLAQGVFPLLDFSFDLRYRVQSPGRHRVASDRYLVRLTFQTGRAEMMVHHLMGLRRVDPEELIRLLLSVLNAELAGKGYDGIELEEAKTD